MMMINDNDKSIAKGTHSTHCMLSTLGPRNELCMCSILIKLTLVYEKTRAVAHCTGKKQ